LADVKREDLRSIMRLFGLHREAVGRGLAKSGDAGELEFFAAAVHAVRIAKANPCGLFATIVRKGLWSFVSQSDEDHARGRLRDCRRAAAKKLLGPATYQDENSRPPHFSKVISEITSQQFVLSLRML